ncbi:flagellar motor switch protein FliM [Pirellula staleyi DSM 6068]|uniref:Flagellar motor switch protein FliM n=1 Tax=Pirellula staleyi (strain ATCC 27377 / DSM 6068 / ICPB 4128) TaxID=530564 RepID=D2R066_PIRSD|nr:flagellar motor switch protein FliM [Pirellula staleyi]ADB18431.1 flagellar motor switch protein FliM [Pirellula staleyi DSM 6068]
MADEVLSQAEVESLLSAMEASGPRTSSAAISTASVAPPSKGAIRTREKVTPYDFKRPERVGKEQMRALQSLHEGFGRNFGAALSALLRSIVEVKLTSVDQLTYSEFVFSLENPTCFNLLRAEPLEGNLILDINPSILYPIIDRLLGGGKEAGPVARRPLTEIELRLVSRITHLFLQELKHAWEGVLPLKLSVDRVESNPQLVQIVPPNEVVVLISFELTLNDVRGMINLCIPFNSIERIGSKLTSNNWVAYGKGGATPQSIAQISKRLDQSKVELVVTLAETTITTGDMIGLRVGDIITTDKDIRTPLEIAVQGMAKFQASCGALKGHKAVRIEQSIAVPAAAAPPPTPATPAPAPAAAGKK